MNSIVIKNPKAYLWQTEFEKNETAKTRIANCEIAENMLKQQAQ